MGTLEILKEVGCCLLNLGNLETHWIIFIPEKRCTHGTTGEGLKLKKHHSEEQQWRSLWATTIGQLSSRLPWGKPAARADKMYGCVQHGKHFETLLEGDIHKGLNSSFLCIFSTQTPFNINHVFVLQWVLRYSQFLLSRMFGRAVLSSSDCFRSSDMAWSQALDDITWAIYAIVLQKNTFW